MTFSFFTNSGFNETVFETLTFDEYLIISSAFSKSLKNP